MGLKMNSFNVGFFIIGEGLGTWFWVDVWLGNTSLANQYPSLYNIVRTKKCIGG
jgi:hypothetical protein